MNENHKMLRNGGSSNVLDHAGGAARLANSAANVAAIKVAAAVPDICGPDIPLAPARGAFAVFQPRRLVPGSAGTAVADGYRGPGEARPRAALRSADVFDRMVQDAARRHERRGEDAAPFVPPLTPGQIAMGRLYRDLVERYTGRGVKCSSLEGSHGGSGGGSFMDALVHDGEAVRRMRARIGSGVAMGVRRVRPSCRGATDARIIRDRDLVDLVCLGDQALAAVLKRHGWAKTPRHMAALRGALSAALDRMQGHHDMSTQNIG